MVQDEVLLASLAPRVASDDPGADEGFDALSPDAHIQAPARITSGDRVERPAHRDAGLAVDPEAAKGLVVKGLCRQGPQLRCLQREVLADSDTPARYEAPVVFGGTGQEDLVQLGHRGDIGHWHHVATAEAPYFTFHSALFMCSLHSRLAKEAVKAVVGAQRHEAVGLQPVATSEDLLDGGFQVVIVLCPIGLCGR